MVSFTYSIVSLQFICVVDCVIYLFMAALGLPLLCGLCLVVASGATLELQCVGFSLWWRLLFRSTGSRMYQFRGCGACAWLPQGSSWTRDRTCVPWFGKPILNQWTTTETHVILFLFTKLLYCVTCRVLVPRPGIKPMSPEVEAWTFLDWATREVLHFFFFFFFLIRFIYFGDHRG